MCWCVCACIISWKVFADRLPPGSSWSSCGYGPLEPGEGMVVEGVRMRSEECPVGWGCSEETRCRLGKPGTGLGSPFSGVPGCPGVLIQSELEELSEFSRSGVGTFWVCWVRVQGCWGREGGGPSGWLSSRVVRFGGQGASGGRVLGGGEA